MPEVGPSTDELALAVSGLAGIVGFLLLPMLGAWLSLLIQWLESSRSGLGPRRPVFGFALVRALFLSFLWSFFFVSLIRSAGELREVRAEAPVFGSAAAALVIGTMFWAMFALALRTLRKNRGRRRPRGVGTPLR